RGCSLVQARLVQAVRIRRTRGGRDRGGVLRLPCERVVVAVREVVELLAAGVHGARGRGLHACGDLGRPVPDRLCDLRPLLADRVTRLLELLLHARIRPELVDLRAQLLIAGASGVRAQHEPHTQACQQNQALLHGFLPMVLQFSISLSLHVTGAIVTDVRIGDPVSRCSSRGAAGRTPHYDGAVTSRSRPDPHPVAPAPFGRRVPDAAGPSGDVPAGDIPPGDVPPVLAVDLGTSHVKAALIGPDGRIAAEAQVPLTTERASGGLMQQEVAEWSRALR